MDDPGTFPQRHFIIAMADRRDSYGQIFKLFSQLHNISDSSL